MYLLIAWVDVSFFVGMVPSLVSKLMSFKLGEAAALYAIITPLYLTT